MEIEIVIQITNICFLILIFSITMDQMYFSGKAGCSSFKANPFRKNICTLCQSSIQDHSGASDTDIANAIEYSADNVPTLILRRQNNAQ